MKSRIRLFLTTTILLMGLVPKMVIAQIDTSPIRQHPVQDDAYGISLGLVSLLIIFIVLTSMYLIFKYISKIYNKDVRKKFNKKKGLPDLDEETEDGISGEVSAVLAMTLYMYRNEMHDIEKTVLTIKKVSRTYSPWSSKIYGLNKLSR